MRNRWDFELTRMQQSEYVVFIQNMVMERKAYFDRQQLFDNAIRLGLADLLISFRESFEDQQRFKIPDQQRFKIQ